MSVIWLGAVAVTYSVATQEPPKAPISVDLSHIPNDKLLAMMEAHERDRLAVRIMFITAGLGGPVLLFVAGLLVAWVTAGFRRA